MSPGAAQRQRHECQGGNGRQQPAAETGGMARPGGHPGKESDGARIPSPGPAPDWPGARLAPANRRGLDGDRGSFCWLDGRGSLKPRVTGLALAASSDDDGQYSARTVSMKLRGSP